MLLTPLALQVDFIKAQRGKDDLFLGYVHFGSPRGVFDFDHVTQPRCLSRHSESILKSEQPSFLLLHWFDRHDIHDKSMP